MSYYEVLTFFHVASAIIWLGAGFMFGLLVFGAERAGDRRKEASYHQDVGWLAPRLFIPASLSTLALGILMVLEGPWTFDQLWITIALVGWAVSFLLGILYFKPEGERIGQLVEEHGPGNQEADHRVRRLNIIDRVQLTILFLVVLDMVAKPASGDDTILIIGGAILGSALVLGAARVRAIGGSTPPAPGDGAAS